MTTEEKAKKYDEALEWIRKVYPTLTGADKEDAEHYFPELTESEDERIRKCIIRLLQVGGYMPLEDKEKAFAWLEKQKEQKSAGWSEKDESYLQTVINEMEANKKEALEYEHKTYDSIISWLKSLKDRRNFPKSNTNSPNERSEVKYPKDIEKDAAQFCSDKGFNITSHQAKEIAKHYLMIGHNEGYVEGRKNAHIPAKELGLPSSMDYKQEWSEEDESMLNIITTDVSLGQQKCGIGTDEWNVRSKAIRWLKSLPKRFNLKPEQKWSEEDRDRVAQYLHNMGGGMLWSKATEITSDILDILRPQPKVEWSEDDRQKLNRIYEILGHAADDKGFLTSKRIIGDNEAIELQDFLKSLPKRFNLQPQAKQYKQCIYGDTPSVERCAVCFARCNIRVKEDKQKPEAKLTGWVARDRNGEIYVYEDYPEKDSKRQFWFGLGSSSRSLDRKSFPGLKWEDEPVEVEITIRKV